MAFGDEPFMVEMWHNDRNWVINHKCYMDIYVKWHISTIYGSSLIMITITIYWHNHIEDDPFVVDSDSIKSIEYPFLVDKHD